MLLAKYNQEPEGKRALMIQSMEFRVKSTQQGSKEQRTYLEQMEITQNLNISGSFLSKPKVGSCILCQALEGRSMSLPDISDRIPPSACYNDQRQFRT